MHLMAIALSALLCLLGLAALIMKKPSCSIALFASEQAMFGLYALLGGHVFTAAFSFSAAIVLATIVPRDFWEEVLD